MSTVSFVVSANIPWRVIRSGCTKIKMSFLRKALVAAEAAILSSKQSMGMSLKLPAEKELFLFDSRAATSTWILSTDRSIGGLSEAKWGYHDPTAKRTHDSDGKPTGTMFVRNDDGEASAVFTGRLSLACEPTEVGIVRSGYCAVRGTLPRDLLLHGYEGITMRVMTDGREYRLNAQMDGWNPMNLYMGFIRTPPNEWVEVELPFRDFLLTAKGYYKFNDPTRLNPASLRSIGIAIADQKEGDFEFRVQWIKAVAKVESRDVGEDDDDDSVSDPKPSRLSSFNKSKDLAI